MRIVWIGIGLAVLFLIPFFLWDRNFTAWFTGDAAIQWIRGWGALGWLAVIVLLLLDIVLPVPGTAVMSAAGFLYGTFVGGIVCSVGAILSGLTAYVLCRRLGQGFAEKLAGPKDLEKGRIVFERNGILLIAVSRSLPLLAEVGACLAGLTRMPFPAFSLALVMGCVPMAFIFSYIGAIGQTNAGLALLLSLVVPVVLWSVIRLWYRKSTEAGSVAPGADSNKD